MTADHARSCNDPADVESVLYDEAGFTEVLGAVETIEADRERRMSLLADTALTVDEAAERLRVPPSQVRQRARAGTLWSVMVSNERLLPRVQFTSTGLVPNIEKVLVAVPRGVHPLSVWGLLTQPHADLALEGRPASIVQWLSSDGYAGAALAIVSALNWTSA